MAVTIPATGTGTATPAIRTVTVSGEHVQVVQPLAAQGKPDWGAFDKYVAKAATDWRIPALAIAVVKDDSVVFAKGYGVLQKGTSQPANEHTRFAIGSTTKAMTSAASVRSASSSPSSSVYLVNPVRSTKQNAICTRARPPRPPPGSASM